MNIKRYINLLQQKKINNIQPFKTNQLWIDNNNLNLKVVHLNTVNNLIEYVKNLHELDNNACYALKNIFYLDINFKYLDVDVVIFDNKMKIIDLRTTINKYLHLDLTFNPVNILIMDKNMINYHNLKIDQKINFSR